MKIILSFLLSTVITFWSFSNDHFIKGKKLYQTSQYDSAHFYFNKALNTCQNCNDTTKARIILYRGKSFQALHNFESALIDLTTALKIFEKKGDINGRVSSLLAFVEFYRNLHNFDKASEYLLETNAIIENSDVSKINKALFYNRYAAFLTETSGDSEKIIWYSEQAIKAAKDVGDKSIEASSLNEIGYIYFNLQDSRSFEYFEQSLAIYEELNNPRYSVSVIVNIARNYHTIGAYNSCIEYCDRGLILTENQEWNVIQRDLYYYKYLSYSSIKDYENALETLKEYYHYGNLVIELERKSTFEELQVKYDVIEKDNQILVEQEKSKSFQQDSEQKQKEIKSIVTIVVLLCIVLFIALFAYFKIRRTNKLLNSTLSQKDVLLQEVHHRVKNNLTLLNSLLYLRAKASDDPTLKLVLNECQSRVQAMSIIHQNLYDVEDASIVDFRRFLDQLLTESHLLFGSEDQKNNKHLETNNISFDMGFTIFLGLILNEFITNTYKYGFNNSVNNSIEIILSRDQNQYTLTYKDSGIGLPSDFDLNSSIGFGFKLINIMLKQIDAKLDYDKSSNTYTINFSK